MLFCVFSFLVLLNSKLTIANNGEFVNGVV